MISSLCIGTDKPQKSLTFSIVFHQDLADTRISWWFATQTAPLQPLISQQPQKIYLSAAISCMFKGK